MLVGCSVGSETSHADEHAEARTAVHEVVGGPESTALGVVIWKLYDDGLIEGRAAAGEVVAKFQASRAKKEVVALLPSEGGVVSYGPNGHIQDSLTPEARKYRSAMVNDLTARSRQSTDAAQHDEATTGTSQPLWIGPFACCYATVSANYYYWVDDNTGEVTPYCHLDVFTSEPCSGLTSCFDYGYSTGCLYWI